MKTLSCTLDLEAFMSLATCLKYTIEIISSLFILSFFNFTNQITLLFLVK